MACNGGLNFGWPFKEGLIPFWGFWNSTPPANPLAPNPLFGNGCNQEFFSLRDLYAEARSDNSHFFANPCNSAVPIPEAAYPRMESLPTLTWGHNEYNLPTKTYIPIFGSDGSYEATDISAATSTVESALFDGNSSIAGVFYQGDNFPAYYKGLYFHADYSGWIKVLYFGEDYTLEKIEPFHDDARQVIQLIEHPIDGCLYYISFRNAGSIHKICYGGNPPPIAKITADTIYGSSPLMVQFDASQSYDPFGLPITYHWDFGDGTESTDIAPSHAFSTNSSNPMPFTVTLTVTDSLGVEGTENLVISLNNTPPVVDIINPLDSSFYSMKDKTVYRLEAAVTDAEHQADELSYEWQTALHHNSHNHPEAPSNERSPLAVITPVGCEADATYWFRIRLTVADAAGLQTTKEVDVFPYCGPDFFALANLNASANETAVSLSWEITQEEEVEHYEVQRSPFFETIGVVSASGIGAYAFTDISPLNGDNFYRIKALRSDGVFDYSNSVKISFPPKSDFVIYPNPTSNLFNIEIQKANAETIRLELFDANGKRLIDNEWSSTPGALFQQGIIAQSLSAGIYFYRVKDGEQLHEGTLMVR
ncbi:MAG: PKD domain-containing protein [Bacteroidota bacterium]